MQLDLILELAKDCGFSVAAALDPKTLEFRTEVRDMCAADRCNSYNQSWSCPPAIGGLEEISGKCAQYSHGILVQTIGQLEDEFDYESIMGTASTHESNFQTLTAKLHDAGYDMLPMGAGACRRCESCTWPDSPCRFPHLVFPSMEACGLVVSDVCRDNGVPYYYGKNTIAFVSCYLFKI